MAKVMVVEDTAIIRESVAKILRREGFETYCASNGEEAMAAMEHARPDLLLLDLMMPVMDGMQFLEQIRLDPRWHDTPVIVMTALQDPETEKRVHQLGAKEYLLKASFSVAQMIDQIRRHIGLDA
jgi:CheY-like chemotaxis protein